MLEFDVYRKVGRNWVFVTVERAKNSQAAANQVNETRGYGTIGVRPASSTVPLFVYKYDNTRPVNVLVRTGRGGVNQHGEFTDGIKLVSRRAVKKGGNLFVTYKCKEYTVRGDEQSGRYICLNEKLD